MFQRLSGSALASLYGTNGSILENHHVDHTIRILRIKECDIFVNLTATDDQRVMRLLRQIILATDLENHLQLVSKIRALASRGSYDANNVEHHLQLLSILVTASDLSDQCKPWVNTRVAASLIYKEFFHQGDSEKSLDIKPAHSMDRHKAFIPDLQIGFLDSIVLPCFQNFCTIRLMGTLE
ncbi:cGMP-dependent 3',5'-cyclic phosphodiesterase [Paragonimus westermani]|uniref:cGMP-dependent 3',5'-cyclic phosphodiesterase n=1 Tax=Paragonimus westermani TaxID=34504 RepID=A0A5J4P445_9TREM|nr:cGMP-dependent 3',5'-cyclic phosphodiesterase [Paragonimus westermani]